MKSDAFMTAYQKVADVLRQEHMMVSDDKCDEKTKKQREKAWMRHYDRPSIIPFRADYHWKHEGGDDMGNNPPRRYPYTADYIMKFFVPIFLSYKIKFPQAPRRAKRWLAQYHFWREHELEWQIPWTGGDLPEDNAFESDEFPDGFGPASWTNTPAGWIFPLPKPKVVREYVPTVPTITLIGEGGKNVSGVKDMEDWDTGDYYPSTWKEDSCWHTGEYTPWILENDCSSNDSELHSEAGNNAVDHGDATEDPNQSEDINSDYRGFNDNEEWCEGPAYEQWSTFDHLIPENHCDELYLDPGPAVLAQPSSDISRGSRGQPYSSSTSTIPLRHPNPNVTWNNDLGTVKLEPASDTHLVGFETTKLQISANCQASLMANAHRELVSLEEQSRARILIFDPFRAQDGKVSDTALVFIQGSPHARNQAVRLITAFQTNLEAVPLHSNVNFTFLGPGRSKGRKKNGQKKKK
ncbi:hypothetical protein NHQ30_001313 [Ciborinia camelliae]|nr:hypothetical protein NHQ30_001313 [Ciborinia camelliae]